MRLLNARLVFLAALGVTLWRAWRMRYMHAFEDEADAMTIGWLVSRGYHLYSQVFANHMPVSYFLSALVTLLFPEGDHGRYRLVPWFCWALAAWSLALSPALERCRDKAWFVGALFLCAVSLQAQLWWGHMILPDGIWASFFACFFALFFLPALTQKAPGAGPSFWAGLALALAVFTSHLAILAGLACVPFVALSVRRQVRSEAYRAVAGCLAGLSAGVLLVALALYFFGDFRGFWREAVEFNFTAYTKYALATQAAQTGLWTGMLQSTVKQFFFLKTVQPLYLACLLLSAVVLADFKKSTLAWAIGLGPALVTCFATVMRIGIRDVFVHDAPLFTLAIFLGAFSLARLSLMARLPGMARLPEMARPWVWRLAVLVFMAGTQQIARHRQGTWYHGQDPMAWMPELRPFVAYVAGHSLPSDKISVVNNAPIFYLLSNREPAQDSISYMPWLGYWEERRGWGRTACQQAESNHARFILMGAGYGWGSCFYALVSKRYHRVMKNGELELWEWTQPSA